MIRRLASAALLGLLWCGAALAWAPPSPVVELLEHSTDPADLRARLRAHRDSVASSDSLDAAEAWYWLGVSHGRSGERDASIAALRRSHAVRRGNEDAVALADALVRGSREDAAEAARLLAPALLALAGDRSPRGAAMRLRVAWADARAGNLDAAARTVLEHPDELLAPSEPIPNAATWAARFAPVLLAHGDATAGRLLLARALAATRGRDSALVALARRHAPALAPAALARAADSALALSAGGAPLARFAVRADDGARLAGWAMRARPRSPLALVAISPDAESFAGGDSLVAQLHRAGVAVALVDPRGVRASASAATPVPGAWGGREDAFAERTARDLAAAIAPALAATGADPARVFVIAEGSLAMAGALAAKRDARVRAVVFAGASPSGVERGWLVGTLVAARVPAFFLTAPEDVYTNEVLDRLVALLPPRQVRIVDSESPGRGVELFRGGPASVRRLNDWLASEWKSRPSTPRAPRR